MRRLASWLLRVGRGLLVVVVLLAASALVAVQVQQRVYKHHVDRLLADLDSLELHKSTWSDMQEFMQSWGRWGHYEGDCNASDCRYDVLLEDFSYRLADRQWFNSLLPALYAGYERLGGRASTVRSSLIVREGFVVRKGMYAMLQVPKSREANIDYSYGLMTAAVSLPRLAKNGAPTYAEHGPYYNARRPGGCTSCEMVTLVYSDHTPQDQVRALTRLDTACLAGKKFCLTPEDLQPSTRPFHYYDEVGAETTKNRAPEQAHSCNVPLWVRGRDASEVMEVEVLSMALSVHKQYSDERRYPLVTARVISTLKGRSVLPGSEVRVAPFQPTAWNPGIAEPMQVGKRYFVLSYERPETVVGEREERGGLPCTVVEEGPQTAAELQRGVLLDDELSGTELDHWPF